MAEVAVETQGLRELRRDLKRLQPAIDRELAGEIREAGDRILSRARSSPHTPRQTGELAGSLRLSVTTRGVSIYSRLPQAPVVHWGGTIAPRGVPIQFPRTEFISREVEADADELLDDVGDAVEHAAYRAGWRR